MSTTARRAYALGAVFLVAVGMRSQLSGLPPLLPQVEADLGTSHAWGGFLISLSFVMMGLGALAASATLWALGSVRGITVATVVIALSGVARAAAPNAFLVTAVGVPLGLAIGLETALLPVVTTEHFRQRPGFGTGAYVVGISVGSALSLAAAVPIAEATGSWRFAVLTFAATTLLLAVPWFAFSRRLERTTRLTTQLLPRLPRSAAAWLPVAIFSLQLTLFLGLSTWLPSAYVERGWTETNAGLLGSGLLLSSLVGSAATPLLTDKPESTGRYLIITALGAVIASFGLVVQPAAAWAWTMLAGASTGGLFVLSFKLPIDLSDNVEDVAGLSALMLAFGYWTGGAAPVLLGVLRDVSGTFSASFASLGILSVGLLMISAWLARSSSRNRNNLAQ